MYLRSEKNNHDRGRSTLRERARSHFLKEKKDMVHELEQNRDQIKKLLNEGFVFDSQAQAENLYQVFFVHPKTSEKKECIFNFETNFKCLESSWNLSEKSNKSK